MITGLPDYWFNKSGNTQRIVKTTDSGGGPIAGYADYLIGVSMRIVPASGGERGAQARLTTENPTTIYVNGAPDIVATDRIVCNSKVYDVQSVNNPDEADAYLILGCELVLPAGVGA